MKQRAADLRHRAERQLLKHPAKTKQVADHAHAQRTLQELQIHQIELELQNEELKLTKAEVDAGLEKFTDLYDFAPVGYFTLTTDGTIQQVNLTATSMVGVQRSRLVGKRFGLLLAPGLRPDFNDFLAQVFADDIKQSGDFELLRQDQPPLIVNIAAKRQINEKECHAVVVDITDRKKVENILRRNEALFSALLNQAPIGVYVVDDQLRMVQVNPKALPVFKNVRKLIGCDYAKVIHSLWSKQIADQILKRFQHTLKTGEPYQSPEFAAKRKDTGAKEIYEWQIQRVTLPSGDHRVVCFFNDITERKRIEGAQRRLEVITASNTKLKQEIIHRQAVEAALTKSEMLAQELLRQSRQLQKNLRQMSHQNLLALENQRKEISHELHDKISQVLIGINVRLAVFTRTAALNPRAIAPVRQLVEKAVKIVHDYARELRPAMLDQLGLIPAIRTYIDEIPKRKGRLIHFSASAGVEALDNDKRTVLYRVAQEALINVAKHARAHVVKVSLQKIRGSVRLEIADDGKAFEVDRLSSTQWSHRLGLTGMRERVEMVGGLFSVESSPGQGTTIRAEVPIGKSKKRK
ncbi:PAS domain S-box protein [Prosthecobacter sp.]|uniref:PAS domain-containing sensor histidine kinase n=1 Tax=Prosthecobacter sp. TaxID=1965333 RepID=UPI002ABA65F8|nr:PAS domain S-box protein [Prosthecobacter sp.]MDZ4401773.1 PAS domain S-box protein [Prosthecobacter sp.]